MKKGLKTSFIEGSLFGFFDWQGAEYRRLLELIIPRRLIEIFDATLGLRGVYKRQEQEVKNGAPRRIRTSDHLVRSQVLYPAELWVRGAHIMRANNGWRNGFLKP